MDYDEQHRICEKELELDDAYTVAMDAMPEHWKEEADAQLTYLICLPWMKLVFLLKSMEGFLSSQVVPASGVFRAANHSTLEAWITISIWERTPEVCFLSYR